MADGHHGGTRCCTSSGTENQGKAASWNGRWVEEVYINLQE